MTYIFLYNFIHGISDGFLVLLTCWFLWRIVNPCKKSYNKFNKLNRSGKNRLNHV